MKKKTVLERRVLDKPHEKYKQVQNKNRKWEKSISQKIHIFKLINTNIIE